MKTDLELLNGDTSIIYLIQGCLLLKKCVNSKKIHHHIDKCQKQPSRGVLKKRCSENIQQIYRRTPVPKCDFNEVAK